MPVVAVTHVGYIVAAVVVSFVMPVFAALVASVAEVAVVAFPDSAPTKVVDVTDVSPARVVDEDPSEIAVDPTVIDEFVNAPLGMLVSPAPEPENCVAVSTPVDGTKESRVLVTLVGRFPVLAVTHVG